MAAKIFFLLLPLLAFVGAQQTQQPLDEKKTEAEKSMQEAKAQAAKEIDRLKELISETETYITKAYERFSTELQKVANTSKENIFQNTQTYTTQAIIKRPSTVFTCICKAHKNGVNNVNGHHEDYNSKLTKNHNQALEELVRINECIQLLSSVKEAVFASPSATLETCKDTKCVDKIIEEVEKLSANFQLQSDKLSGEVSETRIQFNKNQNDNLNAARTKMQSAETSANRAVKYC